MSRKTDLCLSRDNLSPFDLGLVGPDANCRGRASLDPL